LCLAFGADGSELFAASGSTVWSLDPRAGAVRRATTLDRARVQSLAVSSDGEDLAVGTRDGRVLRLSS
jgi:hypothetical protein